MNRPAALLVALLPLPALFPTAAPAATAYVSDELILGVFAGQNGQGERLATLHSGASVDTLAVSGEFTQVRLNDGTTGWVKSTYLTTREPATSRLKQLEEELDRSRATTPALAEAAARSEVEHLKRELAKKQAEIDAGAAASAAAGAATSAAAAADAGAAAAPGASAAAPGASGAAGAALPGAAAAARAATAAGKSAPSSSAAGPASAGNASGAAMRAPDGAASSTDLVTSAPLLAGAAESTHAARNMTVSARAMILAAVVAMALGFWLGYATLARRVRHKFGGIKVY